MKNRIGIMQGRVLPQNLKVLQIFPIYTWEKELDEIYKLGFRYVELLFDKELLLDNLLKNANSAIKLGLVPLEVNNKVQSLSICLDYFANLDLSNDLNRIKYFDKLIAVINDFSKTGVEILVLPILANNFTNGSLIKVLNFFAETGIDGLCKSLDITLAIELNLPAQSILSAFNQFSFANIKICYDLGNAAAQGRIPEVEINILRNLIYHIHIKDTDDSGKNVLLGTGNVDFPKCVKVLKNIDYQGMFILETAYFREPAFEAKKNLDFLNKILEER